MAKRSGAANCLLLRTYLLASDPAPSSINCYRGNKMRSTSHVACTTIAFTLLALSFPFSNLSRPLAAPAPAAPSTHDRLLSAYAQLPVAFVENRGQTDARVRYYARGNGFAFDLMTDGVRLALSRSGASSPVGLWLRFVGSNGSPAIVTTGQARELNYFHGSDPSSWRTPIPQYQQTTFRPTRST